MPAQVPVNPHPLSLKICSVYLLQRNGFYLRCQDDALRARCEDFGDALYPQKAAELPTGATQSVLIDDLGGLNVLDV